MNGSSAVGGEARGVTELHRREGGALVLAKERKFEMTLNVLISDMRRMTDGSV